MILNKEFYPTPEHLIWKMMYKTEIKSNQYILEPSAGDGRLIQFLSERFKSNSCIKQSEPISNYLNFDVIEIDENLTHMLRGKGLNVVHDDFLTFNPHRYYDLIFMNPPFSNGCEHLLKAIEIQERIGGEIVCILNAETIHNNYSNNRKKLLKLLESYNADIKFIEDQFIDAQRKSKVEVALIHLSIPMKDNINLFDNNFILSDELDYTLDELKAIKPNLNKLEQLILECDLLKESGKNLFKELHKTKNFLTGFGLQANIDICDSKYSALEGLSINGFINRVNLDYWNKFIQETNFKKKLPSELERSFIYGIDKQKNIDFNMKNIEYFCKELALSVPSAYEKSVSEIFDKLTYKHNYNESSWCTNIHYYDGWKTNEAFKINKKVVLHYSKSTLVDLNLIFENLSGLKDDMEKEHNISERIYNNEKNINTKFFSINSYKKGTVHIKFNAQDYLNKFNMLASKGKNWLPFDFGTKPYNDLNFEERQLVKEFGLSEVEYVGITTSLKPLKMIS